MVTASETHQPGTEKGEKEKERERDREKRDREEKWRSRSAQVRSVITGFQGHKKWNCTTHNNTTDYMLLPSRTEYRLDRDGIYRVLYRLSDFYMAFLNASITEQWGEGKE